MFSPLTNESVFLFLFLIFKEDKKNGDKLMTLKGDPETETFVNKMQLNDKARASQLRSH